MLDTTTFVTELYVMCDDFCKTLPPRPARPGPLPSLSVSEVITLSIFGQWRTFASERDFYRFAQRRLHKEFPNLPNRSQFSRLQREYYLELVAFWQHLTNQLTTPNSTNANANANDCAADEFCYEALDATAVATRHVSRRGGGWLSGQSDKGLASRLGWYHGFYLLASVRPDGVFTGWAFGSASAKDQPLATSFFQARHRPHERLPTVGHALPEGGFYLTDSGFQGQLLHEQWRHEYQADVITPPQRVGGPGKKPWVVPWKELRHWIASLRQIVESAFGKLHHAFRLRDERPHTLEGFMTRVAAKITLHNFCIYLNRKVGRPNLAFADLWSW